MIVCIPREGAAIFDLDGTLVDSTIVVERQWTAWAVQHGIDPATVMAVVHGRPSIQTMRMFRPETTFEESSRFDGIEARDLDGLRPVRGARELIQSCIDQGIRWAIVTSGTREMASNRLRETAFPVPKVFVTVEQTLRGKPAPDPFLRAAELLNVAAAECTVFEDAPPGIAAALAAKMRVIAVMTTHPKENLGGASAIVRDLTEITLAREI